jgi:hypothetical protein
MKLVRSRLVNVSMEQRAGTVLLAANGFLNKGIAFQWPFVEFAPGYAGSMNP